VEGVKVVGCDLCGAESPCLLGYTASMV